LLANGAVNPDGIIHDIFSEEEAIPDKFIGGLVFVIPLFVISIVFMRVRAIILGFRTT
jgi:hypothetical protein